MSIEDRNRIRELEARVAALEAAASASRQCLVGESAPLVPQAIRDAPSLTQGIVRETLRTSRRG